MREILFRGKNGSRWFYGWYCGKYCHGFTDEAEESSQIIDFNSLYWHEVDPETVGQFTGLTDKNGKKIFEGDIVALRTSRTHEVKYADGGFYMEGTAIPMRYADKFEVIGNIHDNPELLEV